ncbi:uncharacterized protein LOC131997857 [Stomoxys calcitrans]|nr:uncharacterized protein LOC131997857 [Stomoxys calcitrans]
MEDFAYMWNHCIQQFPLSDDELSIMMGDTHDPNQYNNNMKCFGKCLVEQNGWFIDDVFMEDVYIQLQATDQLSTHVDKLHEFAKECRQKGGANKCDKVHQILNCMDTKITKLLVSLH